MRILRRAGLYALGAAAGARAGGRAGRAVRATGPADPAPLVRRRAGCCLAAGRCSGPEARLAAAFRAGFLAAFLIARFAAFRAGAFANFLTAFFAAFLMAMVPPSAR